jgi:hypothetical protein
MPKGKPFSERISYILPFLPVLFFFLHNSTHFTQLVFTSDVLYLLLAYLLFSLIFFLILSFVLRLKLIQASFLATCFISLLLFFGPLQDIGPLQDMLYKYRSVRLLSNSFLILFSISALIIIVFLLTRKRNTLRTINLYLLTCFSLFIVFELVMLGIKLSGLKNVASLARGMTSTVLGKPAPADSADPDIYHIIFDAYTNAPAFRQYWNYENEIYPFLQSKGFYTADSASSNYISTPFSVSSVFSLQYLKGAEPYLYSNSANFLLGKRVYDHNELFRYLKEKGYQFSIFSQLEDKKLLTGFGPLGVVKPNEWLRKQTAERIYLNPWMQEKFNRLIGKKNAIPGQIQRSLKAYHDYNLKAIKHVLNDCSEYAANVKRKPLFSYTHIMMPHDPYIVDENGNLLGKPHIENADMNAYLAQVKYCNKIIKEIVNCLLNDTLRKKIIVIHGDHGFRHFASASPEKAFYALEAIYFQDQNYTGLTKKESLVNLYRVILNKEFGENLPKLPHRIYELKEN